MKWVLAKNIAKWTWMLSVILFIVLYVFKNKEIVFQAYAMLSIQLLFGAAILIFLARLGLMANMRNALRHFKIHMPWMVCFRIYNLAQLGKYVPGSIWQFVMLIAMLRERGVPPKSIRDTILAENFWALASASILGVLLLVSSEPEFILTLLSYLNLKLNLPTWLLVLLILLSAITIFIILFIRRLSYWLFRMLPPIHALAPLLFVWLFFGAAFWVTISPFTESTPSLFFIVGIYAIAYVVGFLVPFAPAGLGIREAILVFALLPFVAMDVAIFLAAINRIVSLVVEFLAAALCIFTQKKTKTVSLT